MRFYLILIIRTYCVLPETPILHFKTHTMFKRCICLAFLCLYFSFNTFSQKLSWDDVLNLYVLRDDFKQSMEVGLSRGFKWGEVDSTHLLMASHADQTDSTFEKFVTMKKSDGVVYFVWKRAIYEGWKKHLVENNFEYHGKEEDQYDTDVYYKKGMWVSVLIDNSEELPCYILQILTETEDEE
jgi:hypothetical protein